MTHYSPNKHYIVFFFSKLAIVLLNPLSVYKLLLRSTQQERCNTLWVHAHVWRHAVDLWKQELIIMLVRLALIRNNTSSHTNTIEANIVAVSRVCTIANVTLLCTRLKYLNSDSVWRYSWSPNDESYDSADGQILPLTPTSNHQNLKNTLIND